MYRFVNNIRQDGCKVLCERRPDDGVVIGIFPKLAAQGMIKLKKIKHGIPHG